MLRVRNSTTRLWVRLEVTESGYREIVMDINRSNQVFHIYTNVGYKTNQIQVMFLDYGKVWYDNKAI